jgi:O-antigen/teichoic acid export membrane protein
MSLATHQEESNKEIASDSLMMGVAFALVLTVVQRLVGFLRNILFCRFMTDEQLGQWSLIYSFVLMLAPLAVLGLPGCFGRFVEHYQRRGQLMTFLKRINWICGITTSGLAIVLLIFPNQFSWILFRETGNHEIMYAFAFTLISVSVINYLTSLMEALRQIRIVTIMRFVAAILFTIAATTLLAGFENGTLAVTIGLGIGSTIACVPAFWFLWKYRSGITSGGEPLTQHSMWARIAPYATWMWICNLLHNMFEVADRYMLVHCSPVSPEAAQSFVGQYHSGRVVPTVLVGVATMLGGIIMPYMTAHWERGEKHKAAQQLNWSIKLVGIAFTLIGSTVLLAAPWLFNVVLQGRYDDGLAVLPMTLVYCTWFSLFVVAQDYLWVAEKGKFGVVTLGCGLSANLLFNWLLIPEFGLWGAVWATTLANGLTVLLIYSFNAWKGAKPDLGCWLTAGLPLIILLPSIFAFAILAVLILLAALTNCIFKVEEKVQIENLLTKVKDKILGPSE